MSRLSLRVDEALDAKLTEIVESLRADGQNVNTSSVIRNILHQYLETPQDVVMQREAMRTMHRVMRGVSSRAMEALAPVLPGFVDDAMRETDEGSA